MSTTPPQQPCETSHSARGNTYTLRRFTVGEGGPEQNPEAVQWNRAVSQGFHDGEPTAEATERALASMRAAGTRLRSVYTADPVPPAALGAERPVATFCSWDSQLTLGEGRSVPAWLISEVTVRPTHARRGLLRRLMTDDLTEAHRAGFPLAALTASEATIYGRFGFGAATFNAEVTVDAHTRLNLKAPAVGSVEMADNAAVARLAPEIFARFHERTAGSLTRTKKWWDLISGEWNWHKAAPEPDVRTAVHYDGAGEPDGYVSYRFLPTQGYQGTLEVVDLVGVTPQSRIGLWEYLCNLDLVTEVRYKAAQIEDPLMWGMVDMSAYTVRKRYEQVWLRVLDPVAALTARPYTSHRRVTLSIVDSMGFADGIYVIDTTGARTRVERTGDRPRTEEDRQGKSLPVVELPDGADAALNVDSLGSLYLGAVKASTLHDAGLLRVRDATALRDVQALMSTPTEPYCISPF
ncbi:GNAT family N-acetyltransferase [Kocuria tytonis]|uniref:GNAT family N-acetyltransferase n=1 Tax=Kocuria tytonis TaxID=2054280 RepID=A0A495A9N8_9MICC|nr:GNAT family N-acetyltransferase [Kocuria tytonis]RKQ36483.1 GNAT family N-acetyltransferase [Kocuria tytonis]